MLINANTQGENFASLLCCPAGGWLCCAAQTPYNASSCPACTLGQESAGTSSAQAFRNSNSASQAQGENNTVCPRNAAAIFGKCGNLQKSRPAQCWVKMDYCLLL